jgi:hypothetical protein
MVNEVRWRGQRIDECETCGLAKLEIVERCEQYCYSHERPSFKIAEKAIRKPPARVEPIAA